LKTKINNKLEDNNFKTEPLKFIPHISLARIKKIEDSKYFNQLLDKFKNFDKFTQVVEEFYLFESILTTKGAVHNILKTFSIK
jgi:2'-5' RNA ligase